MPEDSALDLRALFLEVGNMQTLAKTWEKAKDNVGFLGMCIAVFVGLFLLALLYERLAMKNR